MSGRNTPFESGEATIKVMKAAFINELGTPGKIRFDESPTPIAGDRAVLVKVAAVTVNPIDTYIRSGTFNAGIPLPFIVGRDTWSKQRNPLERSC